jgi:outer membrane protein OmpA-like peptidoglycan-associated protein
MRFIIMFGGVVALTALCATARAQETTESYLAQHLRAPSQALELKVGTGYTQGIGMLTPSRTLADASGAGIGASVDIDYRLNHRWSIGGEGQFQEFGAEQNSSARGLAFTGGVTYHFNPVVRGDPWLRLGTGFRIFYDNNPTGQQGVHWLRDGFDVVSAKVGYDVRVSEDVAIAPVIGADLNLFIWDNGIGQTTTSAQPATFIYAGLQGRFDIGGEQEAVVARAPPPPPPAPMGVTAPQPQSPISPAPPVEEPKPVSPSLAVSEDIIRECKLNLGSLDKAPKFDFDRSDLLPADFDVLRQISDCFTTGPLKDEGLRLVGRTDPRGTVEYNQKLGMKRAKQVASFLEQSGVDASRMEEVSRGKLDARGHDEATWVLDRRVDILER